MLLLCRLQARARDVVLRRVRRWQVRNAEDREQRALREVAAMQREAGALRQQLQAPRRARAAPAPRRGARPRRGVRSTGRV